MKNFMILTMLLTGCVEYGDNDQHDESRQIGQSPKLEVPNTSIIVLDGKQVMVLTITEYQKTWDQIAAAKNWMREATHELINVCGYGE